MEQAMFSRDGYLIDQRQTRTLPYGRHTSDYNGCGWMAGYNVLHALGLAAPADAAEICAALSQGLWLGGSLGTGPLRLARFLAARGAAVQKTVCRKTAQMRAQTCRVGFIMYWTGRGAHFVAFVPETAHQGEQSTANACAVPPQARNRLRFLNAICGEEHHCDTLAAFFAQHCKGPLVFVVTVPQSAKHTP